MPATTNARNESEPAGRLDPLNLRMKSFARQVLGLALTRYKGKWWTYYGGSKYYTCLATATA